MLEKLVRTWVNTIRKVSPTVALSQFLLWTTGCSYYQIVDPDSIEPVEVLEREFVRRGYTDLTPGETIEFVETPEQAKQYLNRHFVYEDTGGFMIPGILNTTEHGRTFKYLHHESQGICFEYSIAAAVTLSDNGFPPLILNMRDGPKGHTVFLYRTENGFGMLGNTSMTAQYPTVEDLIIEFNAIQGKNFGAYFIVNLDQKFPNREWLWGDVDLYLPLPMFKYQKIKEK